VTGIATAMGAIVSMESHENFLGDIFCNAYRESAAKDSPSDFVAKFGWFAVEVVIEYALINGHSVSLEMLFDLTVG
jgi:hypothetical protein